MIKMETIKFNKKTVPKKSLLIQAQPEQNLQITLPKLHISTQRTTQEAQRMASKMDLVQGDTRRCQLWID